MFTPITTYVEDGLARLITQYGSAQNLQNLLTAIIQQVQIIENALVDMNTERYINEAFGQQLDNIGQIIGLARVPGTTDSVYKQQILGQIKINSSQGQPEQIIQLVALLTGSSLVLLYEGHNAEISVQCSYSFANQAAADAFILLVEQATAAGVRVDEIDTFDPNYAFSYDGPLSGQGYDDGSGTQGGGYAQGWVYCGISFAYAGSDTTGGGYGSPADPLNGGVYLT